MASAFAMMAKRRYQSIVAKQAEKAAKQRRKTGMSKPPVSSDDTLVWYWELDGVKITVMYDIAKREVWCNGLVLNTEAVLPSNQIEQCSLGFTINTTPYCESCGLQHKQCQNSHNGCTNGCPATQHNTDKDDTEHHSNNHIETVERHSPNSKDSNCNKATHKTNTEYSNNDKSDATNETNRQSNELSTCDDGNTTECDCLSCHTGKHECIIKVVRIGVGETLHELYVDGVMIQEHRDDPYNFNVFKQESEKKND